MKRIGYAAIGAVTISSLTLVSLTGCASVGPLSMDRMSPTPKGQTSYRVEVTLGS